MRVGRFLPGWRYVLSGVVLLSGSPALADAIDGDWCNAGRHLAIEGPTIVTPGGRTIKGNYERHAFAYLAPEGEKEAGLQIFMVLLDEETMEFHPGSESAPGQIWRRCVAPGS